MSDTQTLPTVTTDDLEDAGFPSGMQMAVGLQVFFNDRLYQRCSSIAVRMSNAASEGLLPKHLAGKAAACFAIVSRAITWNIDPYAVALSTYQTPNGAVGYEGKLIQAILENSGRLEGGVSFELFGDWSKVKGKFKIMESSRGGKYPVHTWTPEDAKGLYVVVSAQIKGRKDRSTLRFDLDEAFPLNSPLWATAPNRQIRYTAVRAFANHELPSILMGVPFDVDPVNFYGQPMTDITPPAEGTQQRAPASKKRANEFDRTEMETFQTKPAIEEKAELEKKPEPEKRPEEPPTQTAQEGHGSQGQAQSAEAPANGQAPAAVAESESQPAAQAEQAGTTQALDPEALLKDGERLLAEQTEVEMVGELRDDIASALEGDLRARWFKMCDERIFKEGEKLLAGAKQVGMVSDARARILKVMHSTNLRTVWEKTCDERQRALVEAMRPGKGKK